MAELGILLAFIGATLFLMGGLMVVFRGWMQRRVDMDKDNG